MSATGCVLTSLQGNIGTAFPQRRYGPDRHPIPPMTLVIGTTLRPIPRRVTTSTPAKKDFSGSKCWPPLKCCPMLYLGHCAPQVQFSREAESTVLPSDNGRRAALQVTNHDLTLRVTHLQEYAGFQRRLHRPVATTTGCFASRLRAVRRSSTRQKSTSPELGASTTFSRSPAFPDFVAPAMTRPTSEIIRSRRR